MQYPSREMGVMNDEEFSEAVDHILQVPDEKRRKALFAETLLLQQVDQPDVFHVHVSKLACKSLKCRVQKDHLRIFLRVKLA